MWEWGSKAKATTNSDKKPSAVKLSELRKKTLEERRLLSQSIITQYPDRLPVIITRSCGNEGLPDIEKIKFLIPRDHNYTAAIQIIRKHVAFTSQQAIFLFVGGGHIPSASLTIGAIYEQYKDPDGFLYITYNGENTFG